MDIARSRKRSRKHLRISQSDDVRGKLCLKFYSGLVIGLDYQTPNLSTWSEVKYRFYSPYRNFSNSKCWIRWYMTIERCFINGIGAEIWLPGRYIPQSHLFIGSITQICRTNDCIVVCLTTALGNERWASMWNMSFNLVVATSWWIQEEKV